MLAYSDANLNMMDDHMRILMSAYRGPDTIPAAGVTTLMLRNLPRAYTVDAVLKELRAINLMDYVDFVYMPWGVRRETNISYMFVNFVTTEHALQCFFALSGQTWSLVETQKRCRIVPAHVQGIAANLSNYLSACPKDQDAAFAPLLFNRGQRLDLDDVISAMHPMDGKPETSWYSGHHFQEEPSNAELVPALGTDGSWEDDVDDFPDPELDDVLEFRRAFGEFCKTATSSHDSGASLSQEHIAADLPDHAQLWLQLRRLCSAFAEQFQEEKAPAAGPLHPVASRQVLETPEPNGAGHAAALPCSAQHALGEAASQVPLPVWSGAGANKGRAGVAAKPNRWSGLASKTRCLSDMESQPGPDRSRGPFETSGASKTDQAQGILAEYFNDENDCIFAGNWQ